MRFLTVEDVLELHALQLERFGGGAGIRSLPLLESAVAQPEASFGGAYIHADLFEMAANGHSLATADDRLYELAINVAAGSATAAGGAGRNPSRTMPASQARHWDTGIGPGAASPRASRRRAPS